MNRFRNLMFDMETLSLDPNAHIVSFGAVWFDDKGNLGDELLVNVDPSESNGVIDAATVAWWMGQSPAGRNANFLPMGETVRLPGALRCLNHFIAAYWEDQIASPDVWTRGHMDPVWLQCAFKRKGLDSEIDFRWFRDQRTLTALSGIDTDHPEGYVQHSPLDDCKVQILDLVRACGVLGVSLK